MAPPHVHMLLHLLPNYFDSSISIELVDRICNGRQGTVLSHDHGDGESDNKIHQKPDYEAALGYLENYDMIKKAIEDPKLSELMCDIIIEVTTLRNKPGVFDQYDNWQYLSKKLDINKFLAFIYGLVRLAECDPSEGLYRKLSLCAARFYIIMLSTPGQKQTIAFNEHVLSKCLDVFKITDWLREPVHLEMLNRRNRSPPNDSRLLLDYITLLDDVQLLMRCMTLKNCESTKANLIITMKTLLTYCTRYALNTALAEQLADKVFATLYLLCFPEHDDHNQCSVTINMILNKTAIFYTLEYKSTPATFQIQTFFIRLLDQNPTDTCNVLTNFIKSVLTNTPKEFTRPDDYACLVDVAVKYDLAMFNKCNVSIISYLKIIETHPENSTRINILEMLGKLATVDCAVDWELFQSEVSKVPREVEMINILYKKLLEKSNAVKQKAFQCLLRMLENGNTIIKQIFYDTLGSPDADEDENKYLQINGVEELYQTAELDLGISRNVLNFHQNITFSNKNDNPVDQEDYRSRTQPSQLNEIPTLSSNIEGVKIIHDMLVLIPNIIYGATRSPISAIRRVAVSCVEYILKLNRNRIDDPVVQNMIVKLAKDPVMLIRRTTLNVMNNVIGLYPNYLPLIKLWSECLLFFLDDVDQKIKESAMESLKLNVFDNMCRFEDSSNGKVFTPWMIVRSILVLGKINVLKSAVESWIQKSILTSKNLSIIESHIFTVNCSEAWIILSIIACKMKSRNPDMIIKTMSEILQQDMYNSPICLHYILSVIKSWLADFTRPGLNHLFKILSDLLRTGSTNISLVSDIYSLCCLIKEKSDDIVDASWIKSIRDSSAEYLLHYHSHYASMHMTNERYLISLLVYSESVTDLNDKLDINILHILQKYLALIASNENLLSMQLDQNRKINVTITVLARFGLRDASLASTIITDFNKILKFKNIHESVICTLITAFSDLCKRHTSLVESSITTVIGQLNSGYLTVRSVALNNLNELILQDYVKMRGAVLLHILTLIIDEDDHIAAQALYVIQLYLHSKNEKLLKVSFLECIYAFNNYLQYAEASMFPASEITLESCNMAGSAVEFVRKRSEIYDFFAENIDDNSLLKLLRNVNKIHYQLVNGKYVECSQGVATLVDLLYVFKLMCKAKDRDKPCLSKNCTPTCEDLIVDHTEERPSSPKKSKIKPIHTQNAEETTIILEKMVAVFYSFNQEVLKYVKKVDPGMINIVNERLHDLAIVIVSKFGSLTQFAKPECFWRTLRTSADVLLSCKQKSSTKGLKSNQGAKHIYSNEQEESCSNG